MFALCAKSNIDRRCAGASGFAVPATAQCYNIKRDAEDVRQRRSRCQQLDSVRRTRLVELDACR